jgi:hypothetical protein
LSHWDLCPGELHCRIEAPIWGKIAAALMNAGAIALTGFGVGQMVEKGGFF